MRVLPYFAGTAVIVAIGGAVAGAAIDTTPREIFDSSHLPTPGSDIDMTSGKRALTANHYPLETDGETYDVAELRERGLYSQKRYADAYETYEPETQAEDFDFAAAQTDQQRWEAEQRRTGTRTRVVTTTTAQRPLQLDRPAEVSEAKVRYVSRPVVQDTSGAGH